MNANYFILLPSVLPYFVQVVTCYQVDFKQGLATETGSKPQTDVLLVKNFKDG